MNRRSFFQTLAKAAAGFTILPAATSYERIWKVVRPECVPNPEWITPPMHFFGPDYTGEWRWTVMTYNEAFNLASKQAEWKANQFEWKNTPYRFPPQPTTSPDTQ